MIASLRGKVLAVEADTALLEVAGVGFELQLSPASAAKLAPGAEVLLHTYMVVGESSRTLYGFESREQRRLFQMLLPVKGVGPRLALNLMSAGAEHLVAALRGADTASLTALPGVGKRLAERLIMETRDIQNTNDFAAAAAATGGARRDAEQALAALGYGEREAGQALAAALEAEECAASDDSATMVRAALKRLGSETK